MADKQAAEMKEIVALLVTAPSQEEAERIGGALVEERLAACVNVLPGVTSLYMWEGELHRNPEVLMVIKSRSSQVDAVAARVRALHSYDLPETIALPVVGGSQEYLDWVASEAGGR